MGTYVSMGNNIYSLLPREPSLYKSVVKVHSALRQDIIAVGSVACAGGVLVYSLLRGSTWSLVSDCRKFRPAWRLLGGTHTISSESRV